MHGVPAFLLALGSFALFTEVKYCPFTFYIGHIGIHLSPLPPLIPDYFSQNLLLLPTYIPRARGIPRYLVLGVSIGVIIIFDDGPIEKAYDSPRTLPLPTQKKSL